MATVAEKLLDAAETGDAREIKDLDAAARRAVLSAAKRGHTGVVNALLKIICDVDFPDAGADGATALMWAAREGREGVVKALINGNADVDAVDNHGETALMYAAFEGHAMVAAELLDAGASAALEATGGSDKGKTALDIAKAKAPSYFTTEKKQGKAEIAALLEGGVGPRADKDGASGGGRGRKRIKRRSERLIKSKRSKQSRRSKKSKRLKKSKGLKKKRRSRR